MRSLRSASLWLLTICIVACGSVRDSWRSDGACFTSCQEQLGPEWQGGKYSATSNYCVCFGAHDGAIATTMVWKDDHERLEVRWPWKWPARCLDRSLAVCQAVPVLIRGGMGVKQMDLMFRVP